jgi:hypothetical protein
MGNLIDIRLTDPENFDNMFVRTEAPVPTGQMLTLVNHLFNLTEADKQEDGTIQSTFSSRFEQAYEMLKEDNGGKLQSGLNKFLERFPNEGEEYFKDRVKSIGKTIITLEEEQKSDSICLALQNSIGTKELVNWQDKVVKYPILFDVDGEQMKAELDQIRLDHLNKLIYLDDYKNTNFIESFQWKYLDDGYYIQASLYHFAATQHFNDHVDYKDYTVVDEFNFIVSDYNNYISPLVYKVTEDNIFGAWNGFKVGNKRYKGILQLIEELKFSLNNNLWDMSVENFKNKGRVTIPTFEKIEN